MGIAFSFQPVFSGIFEQAFIFLLFEIPFLFGTGTGILWACIPPPFQDRDRQTGTCSLHCTCHHALPLPPPCCLHCACCCCACRCCAALPFPPPFHTFYYYLPHACHLPCASSSSFTPQSHSPPLPPPLPHSSGLHATFAPAPFPTPAFAMAGTGSGGMPPPPPPTFPLLHSPCTCCLLPFIIFSACIKAYTLPAHIVFVVSYTPLLFCYLVPFVLYMPFLFVAFGFGFVSYFLCFLHFCAFLWFLTPHPFPL